MNRMDCVVCQKEAARVACAHGAVQGAAAARACRECALRWACEGAQARCFACNAPLSYMELAEMFPGKKEKAALRARAVERAADRERARTAAVAATGLFRAAAWMVRADAVLTPLMPHFYIDGMKRTIAKIFWDKRNNEYKDKFSIFVTFALSYAQIIPSSVDVARELEIDDDIVDAIKAFEWSEYLAFHAFARYIRKPLSGLVADLHQIATDLARQREHDRSIASQGVQPARADRAAEPPRVYPQTSFLCPVGGCEGLVVGNACAACARRVCPDCREPVGELVGIASEPVGIASEPVGIASEPVGREHVCDPAALASLAQIRATARPCPNCRAPIERSFGCADMFCTACDTAFDWNTGRRIGITRYFHNPHYRPQERPSTFDDTIRDLRLKRENLLDAGNIAAALPVSNETPFKRSERAVARIVIAHEIVHNAEEINREADEDMTIFWEDNLDLRILFAIGLIDAASLGECAEGRERFGALYAAVCAATRAMRDAVDRRLQRVPDAAPPDRPRSIAALARLYSDAELEKIAEDVWVEIAVCQRAINTAASAAGVPGIGLGAYAGALNDHAALGALGAYARDRAAARRGAGAGATIHATPASVAHLRPRPRVPGNRKRLFDNVLKLLCSYKDNYHDVRSIDTASAYLIFHPRSPVIIFIGPEWRD